MKLQIFSRVVVPLSVIAMLNSSLTAQDWGDKMFDRLQIKFGSVARLADTTFSVTVKNPYLEEIRITSLTTSCGCISWTDQVPISIPSRDERRLTIRLDTVRHFGEKHVKAFVTLNEPIKGLTAIVTLPVEGRIRNDFEVRPSSVGFGGVDLGRGASQRISITYKGQDGWKLISAKVGSTHLATQILEQSRAGGTIQYDVLVELKPDAPAGVLRDQLVLTTNEPGNSEVSIPIEARVETDIVVTDAHFGTVTPGRPKSVTVILRGKKPFQIEKVERDVRDIGKKSAHDEAIPTTELVDFERHTSQASDAFKMEFATANTQVHLLTLTFTPPTEAGMIDESFSVTISGRTQPVRFQAHGRILEEAITSAVR